MTDAFTPESKEDLTLAKAVGASDQVSLTSELPVAAKHRGAWAEMIACCWLLENGWEVYRNVSSHGKTDLVGGKGQKLQRFDVKLARIIRKGAGHRPTVKAPRMGRETDGIWPIYVTADGICAFDTRVLADIYEHQLP